MGGLLKKVVFVFLGIAALLVIVAVSFVLLFDPNNFREEIATEVQRETGRELVIEGPRWGMPPASATTRLRALRRPG